MIFKDCDKCPTIKAQSEIIQRLSEEIRIIKRHYREDVESLNNQLKIERQEFEKLGIETKESPPLWDMTSCYDYRIQTQWRANQRIVHYPIHISEVTP